MTPAHPDASGSRPSRREVLAAGAATAVGLAAGAHRLARAEPPALPRRVFGRTGIEVTAFGLGCFPLGSIREEDVAVGVILRALDAGCNYLDTAPSYGRGQSEERVGRALRARPDKTVFVATKTHTRTGDDARRDLEGSLGRLGVERIDLVQVHAVTDAEDLDAVLSSDGPLAALSKARDEGLVRFVGVTGHADPVVMKAAVERGVFDSILFPLNCVDPHHLSFQATTLPAAVENGLGRVAMKVFASGELVKRQLDAAACLRYVYELDVATTIVGCRTVEEVDLAVRVASDRVRLSDEARRALVNQSRPHAGRAVEWYKRD